MTERKYKAYTLWLKFRNRGWMPKFTVEEGRRGFGPNPKEVISQWMILWELNDYWKRGKTWMILPKGQKPAAIQEKI